MEFLAFITLCKSFQPITFLGKFFCFFSADSNSASKFAFYDTHIEYLQKKFWGGVLLPLFANFEVEFRQNRSKNK
jgi:hypothetical protein